MAANSSNDSIKVIQINLARSRSTLLDLVNVCQKQNIDLALIQEPYTSNVGVVRVSGYQTFQRKTSDVVKSAIVCFNRNIKAILQTELSTSDVTTIDINSGGLSLRLISVYNKPEQNIEEILSLLNKSCSTSGRIIIGGDVNSSHNAWNSYKKDDENGEKIVNFAIANDLEILNSGSTPTFDTTRGNKSFKSIVDVTLTSGSLLGHVKYWRVDPDVIPNSDHNGILFEFNTASHQIDQNLSNTTFKYNCAKADWAAFRDSLANSLQDVMIADINSVCSIEQLDSLVDKITKAIQLSCDVSIPKFKRKKNSCPWWNNELQKLKHKVQQKKRRIRSAVTRPPPEAYEELASARDEYTKAIQKFSVKSFKEYVGKQGRDDVWSNVKRLIKSDPKLAPPATLKINNRYTTSAKETAKELLGHFYPDDDTATDSTSQSLLRNLGKDYSSPDDLPFTQSEVIDVFKNMSPKKAPGHDHLTSDIILKFAESHTSILTTLYNKCLSTGLFPTSWKRALVKVLPKPGKDDYELLGAYRPIGLLSVLGKGLESLIKSRLSHDLHVRNQLSKRQFGFTAQTSTSDAIRAAISYIKTAKSQKKQVLAVSLDIKAAFDNAWWPALLDGLRKRNVKLNTYRLIEHYLQNRYVELEFCGEITSKVMTKGCIQGSVTGPTFWNIIIDDLLNTDFNENVHCQAFADDVLLIASHESPGVVKSILDDVLSKVVSWGNAVKLTFGSEKTQVISFTPKSKSVCLRMAGQSLGQVDRIKFLGVIVDWELKFHKHVLYVIKKGLNTFRLLSRISRPTWGVTSEIVKILYQRAVEPIVTYACHIWKDALKYKYILKKLNSFQRPFAVRAAKGFHTISTTSALALADLIPIDLRIKEIAGIEEVKVSGTSTFLPSDRRYQSRVPFTELSHPAIRPAVEWSDVLTPEDAEVQMRSSEVSLFTDGSKLDGKVGAAFIAKHRHKRDVKKQFKLEDYCSVFQAELVAVDEGLKYVRTFDESPVTIFSDSLSALNAISNRGNTNPIVHSIRQSLEVLNSKQITIKFFWAKSHVGIPGNEEADVLAKQATSKRTTPIYDLFPLSHVKRLLRVETLKEWNERYVKSATGKTTIRHLPTIYHSHQLNTKKSATFEMTQVLSGHGFHKSYLKRFKLRQDDQCPCDNLTQQTIEHLVYECPRFARERHDLDGQLSRFKVNLRSLPDVLRHDVLLDDFAEFIKFVINNTKEFNSD